MGKTGLATLNWLIRNNKKAVAFDDSAQHDIQGILNDVNAINWPDIFAVVQSPGISFYPNTPSGYQGRHGS